MPPFDEDPDSDEITAEDILDEIEDESLHSEKPGRGKKIGNKTKSNISIALFISWIAFLAIWLFFFAAGYDAAKNVGIACASFFTFAMIIALMWTSTSGPRGDLWRTRLSIVSGLGWLIFLSIWYPFFATPYTIFQNSAIFVLSTLVLIVLNSGGWMSKSPIRRPRMILGYVLFILWMVFIVVWLWLFAEGYVWERNFAILILSTLVLAAIEIGLFRSVAKRSGGDIKGVGFLFAWLLLLFVWFWFLAEPFNVYQNFAIVIVTFVVFVAIAGYVGKKEWESVEGLDWDD